MARYQACLRALHLSTLIANFQVPKALSHPFRAANQGENEAPDQDCTSDPGLAIPYVSSSSVYEYIAASSSIVANYYTPVPRQDTTSGMSTSTTTVFVLHSTSSSLASPSGGTRPPTSQSAQTGIPQGALTNTIPDSSLTSLTTSEVQTLTEAPVTNTSGVSSYRPRE